MQRLFTPLAHFVVPLAAFLTFMLQPVAGKLLMPVYGGSAGTWLTLSMFFQGALFAGYALAWRGLEKYRTRIPALVAGLAVAAPLSLGLPLRTFPGLSEWAGVLVSLTVSLLLVVLLTTASGLIIQGWIQERRGRVPFYLYGVSNVGSTLALIAYPFAIEPYIGLSQQMLVLKIALWIFAAALVLLCWLQRKTGPIAGLAVGPEPEPEEIPRNVVGTWLLLSFATCTLMLGAIPILGAEYGANPLTWVVPLGIYLLSFSLTFSGWWHPALNYAALVALAVGVFGFMQTKGIGPTYLNPWGTLWLVVILGAGCLGGQGFLYGLRPERRSTFFYLTIAAGGLAGGIFVSALAPHLFNRNIEFTGAAFFLLVFLVLQLLGRAETVARYSLVLLILFPSGWFLSVQLATESENGTKIVFLRNQYGSLQLGRQADRLELSNESTLHGKQVLTPAHRRLATSYYSQGSAAGIVLKAMAERQPALRIAGVGLGTGTLATYGRKDDRIIFWDINPLAIRLAREQFFFLRDSPAQIEIRQGDGRLGIAAARERFDLIVLDAFSGDSVPAHLITREAIAGYLACLDEGILLVHISSRYLDLFPVVATGARHAGWRCLYVNSTPQDTAKVALLASSSSYAVIYPPSRDAEIAGWFGNLEQRIAGFEFIVDPAKDERAVHWTDDRSAIMDLLTWDNLLHR